MKIISFLFTLAVVALGLLLLVSFIKVPGNIVLKIVKSGSMEPSIKTGSLVIVKPSDVYNVGDVIMFGKDTKTQLPTTHRIIADEVRSGVFYYTTKGDANDDPDPQPVAKSEVVGRVIFDIPYLGYILDFAKKPIGFVLLIGVPAAVVVFDEAGNIWKEMRKIRAKKEENLMTDDQKEESNNT